jgi:hypothetical protein
MSERAGTSGWSLHDNTNRRPLRAAKVVLRSSNAQEQSLPYNSVRFRTPFGNPYTPLNHRGLYRGLLAAVLWAALPCGAAAQGGIRVVHVFVPLADNQHQGIVPVPAKLGDGKAPASNLYWGAAYGVKSYFRSGGEWELMADGSGPKPEILERCVFKHRSHSVYMVADAYEGSKIREAVTDFLSAAAGLNAQKLDVKNAHGNVSLVVGGGADVATYVGHDAFMDFQVEQVQGEGGAKPRMAIILACASKQFFEPYLRHTGAIPLLWTTGLLAPEAYVLRAALDGWIADEGGERVRERAARAYDKFQHCGLRAAQKLFVTGW